MVQDNKRNGIVSAQLKTLNLRYMLLKTVPPLFYIIDVGGDDRLSTWNPSVAGECVSLCTNDDAIGKSQSRMQYRTEF